ncbi:MAG: hypothetical protein Q7T11_09165, partial [Deltaproteobacteria bacterium]|nr:hypothetical protein [Deltaproteobacteria bacterium]
MTEVRAIYGLASGGVGTFEEITPAMTAKLGLGLCASGCTHPVGFLKGILDDWSVTAGGAFTGELRLDGSRRMGGAAVFGNAYWNTNVSVASDSDDSGNHLSLGVGASVPALHMAGMLVTGF